MAQVTPRQNAIFVGLEAAPDQSPTQWIQVTPTQANVAVQQAVSDLPPNGGVLYVMPGSATYEFQDTVLVNKPNVVIYFTSGAVLAFSSMGVHKQLIKIVSPRFRCHEARVVYQVQNANGVDNDRSCFLVNEENQNCDDASFIDPTFDIKQANAAGPDILNFSCIRATGQDAALPRRGLRVSGGTFIIQQGEKQTKAIDPTNPTKLFGVCAIRGLNSAETLVTNAVLRGAVETRGQSGTLVVLDNCPASVLVDVICRALDLIPSTAGEVGGSVFRITTNGSNDGHRTVLARISFEVVRARYMIELINTRSDIVAYMNHGRTGDSEASLVADGTRGTALAALAMNFHNVDGLGTPLGTNYMIDLKRISNAVISGHVFLPKPNQFALRVAQGQCSGVYIERGRAFGEQA